MSRDDPAYQRLLLELALEGNDLRRLKRQRREIRNGRLAAELAAAVRSGKKPSAEALREWRSLSKLDQRQAIDSLELPERSRTGGPILYFGPPREETG